MWKGRREQAEVAYRPYEFINWEPTGHPRVGKGDTTGWQTGNFHFLLQFQHFLVLLHSEKGLFHSILICLDSRKLKSLKTDPNPAISPMQTVL